MPLPGPDFPGPEFTQSSNSIHISDILGHCVDLDSAVSHLRKAYDLSYHSYASLPKISNDDETELLKVIFPETRDKVKDSRFESIIYLATYGASRPLPKWSTEQFLPGLEDKERNARVYSHFAHRLLSWDSDSEWALWLGKHTGKAKHKVGPELAWHLIYLFSDPALYPNKEQAFNEWLARRSKGSQELAFNPDSRYKYSNQSQGLSMRLSGTCTQ